MQKKTISTILVLSMVLIISCTGGGLNIGAGGGKKKDNTDIYTGFDGIKLEFIRGSPPQTVLEETTFPVGLRVKNLGAYDIKNDKPAYLILGVERDYNCVESFDASRDVVWVSTNSKCGTDRDSQEKVSFTVSGKSLTSKKGEEEILTYYVRTKQLDPQSETHTSLLYATACYPYDTKITATVCMDTDVLGVKYKNKACSAKELQYPSGQGAPVTVTRIETSMLPEEDFFAPHFVIHLENRGDGEVVREDRVGDACKPRTEINDAIEGSGDYKTMFNTIFVKAYLFVPNEGRVELECSPKAPDADAGYVRLIGKKDLIRCTLPKDKKGVPKNFEPYATPLEITLDYGYTTTISKQYAIEKEVAR